MAAIRAASLLVAPISVWCDFAIVMDETSQPIRAASLPAQHPDTPRHARQKTLFAYTVQLRQTGLSEHSEKECEQILGVRTRLSSHFLDSSPTREEGTNRGGFNLNQRFRPAAQ